MSNGTSIEWTRGNDGSKGATWNPVTGCTKVSAGCNHCYAERITERFHGPGSFATVQLHEDRLGIPERWRKPRRVFVNSMSDLFHDDVPDEFIARVFGVMARTPQHTYQILTKRHGRMRAWLNYPDRARSLRVTDRWPLPNVWLGVSVEDQKWADNRIPALLQTPAAVRFLSCEPLLGPVDLSAWMPPGIARWRCGGCKRFYSGPWQETCPGCSQVGCWCGSHTGNDRPGEQPLGWVIVGGESGPGARPMVPDWARELRDQSTAAGVPFFFKQWGAWAPTGAFGIGGHDPRRGFVGEPKDPHGCREEIARVSKKAAGRLLDGREWNEYPA